MTTDLARRDAQSLAAQLWGDRLQIVKDVVAKGLTDDELEVFAAVAQRTKLDVFARPPQIYPIKRYDKKLQREVLTIQASIDAYRLIAARTREYLGQVGPQWCGPDGEWRDVWLSEEPPAAARVGVRRRGANEPTWSVATFKESAQWFRASDGKPYLGDFWQRMPAQMLAKVAETNALKRAFPNDTAGIELAMIEDEQAAAQARLAERYVQIFGDEERKDDFDAPAQPTLADTIAEVDTVSGEVLREEPPEFIERNADLWAENRRLVAEARKRGVHGATLNTRAGRDTLEKANAELRARIENCDLDRIAESQSRA